MLQRALSWVSKCRIQHLHIYHLHRCLTTLLLFEDRNRSSFQNIVLLFCDFYTMRWLIKCRSQGILLLVLVFIPLVISLLVGHYGFGIPVGARDFSVLQNIQTGLEGHIDYYSVGTVVLFWGCTTTAAANNNNRQWGRSTKTDC